MSTLLKLICLNLAMFLIFIGFHALTDYKTVESIDHTVQNRLDVLESEIETIKKTSDCKDAGGVYFFRYPTFKSPIGDYTFDALNYLCKKDGIEYEWKNEKWTNENTLILQ